MGGTPILNQCLEEAVRLCLQLTQSVAETAGESASLVEDGRDLQRTVSEAAADLHDSYADAIASIERIREGLAGAADASSAAVEALAGRANETSSALGGLGDGVRAQAARLADLRQRVLDRLDVELNRSDAAFQELARAVEGFHAGVDAGLEKSTQARDRIRERVSATEATLDRRQAELVEALGRSTSTGLDVTRGLGRGVAAVSAVMGREVVDFCNGIIESHNQAVRALRRGFTHDPSAPEPTAAWMDDFLDAVWTALRDLDFAAREAEGRVTEMAEVLATAEDTASRSRDAAAEVVGRIAAASSGPLLP